MTTIGNLGIGLFILILVWILALVVFVIAVKTQSNLGWFALLFATILTVSLIAIPLQEQKQQKPQEIEDYSYVYRSILFWVLIISVIIGFFSFFVLHCIEPVRPKLITVGR